ncbi:hypothetical protein N781_09930 [Pontibacillus halophilus JSM 076056 = DSM 19796]|uniref:Uncharacterized protein n=1 Tax=Pontibacillus halophilus JSM 076056 = DSM 19796 TaxID=1385510 RepID=A0A0A5GQB7_9BACI|nr:hypothetical protein [Pontibacillus halophilus]KGX93365.1 hypothetical protein N781_09930 [Pontibacillus halophilus JSM 076056 = DSM 19796]
MIQHAWLRILLACFLLYMAWPFLGVQGSTVATLFWGAWLAFFLLVIGANLAIVLRFRSKPQFHEKEEKRRLLGRN